MSKKCVCDICGHVGHPKSKLTKGNIVVEMVTWIIATLFVFILVMAYSIWRALSRVYLCESCGIQILPLPDSNMVYATKFLLHTIATILIVSLWWYLLLTDTAADNGEFFSLGTWLVALIFLRL